MYQITQLNKIYGENETANHVLKDFSLEIPDKQILCITGASGSGKTTLLNILAALDIASSGTVKYNGTDMMALTPKQRKRLRLNEFGFVFQAFHLVSTLTVHENIILAATAKSNHYDKDFYAQIIDLCGLKEKIRSYPHQLSGGEQQRVAIARALLSRPNVIFADEPTGNLDSVNADIIFSLLSSYARTENRTFIYVTHELSFTRFSDKHIVLKDGIMCAESVEDET